MSSQAIHIIGIGGSGASGVARYLKTLGFTVTGSDNDRTRIVDLRKDGIEAVDGHSPKNIADPDMVLYSPGVYAAGAELAAAKRKKIPSLTWQDFLGRYLTKRPGKGFMVAGTFGKGSTAAIVAHILSAAYLDPLAILGVDDVSWGSNLRAGVGQSWVLEADEYNRHFHNYHPSYVVLTSLEHEHVSTYPTFDEYVESFRKFFAGMRDPKIVVAKRTPSIDRYRETFAGSGVITYSLTEDADVRGTVISQDVNGSRFSVTAPKFGVTSQEFGIKVPGYLHIENAVGAIALTLAAGIGIPAANAGLARFKGLRSRFEVVTAGPHTTVFDYAHTPDRIRPAIAQARTLFPGKRIIVLFEPHLYSRTKQYHAEFTKVLAEADRAYLTDIYPAREANSPLAQEVHSKQLVDVADDRVQYVGTLAEGVGAVEKARTERDVVLVLGAGPIQFAGRRLAA